MKWGVNLVHQDFGAIRGEWIAWRTVVRGELGRFWPEPRDFALNTSRLFWKLQLPCQIRNHINHSISLTFCKPHHKKGGIQGRGRYLFSKSFQVRENFFAAVPRLPHWSSWSEPRNMWSLPTLRAGLPGTVPWTISNALSNRKSSEFNFICEIVFNSL